jgi:predicted DNA-binding transcriptional regulator AlpA
MADQVLIPLPGIGTLSLTRAEYDAALIPIAKPEVPRPVQSKRPEPPAPTTTETASKPRGLRYLRLREVCERVGVGTSTIYKMMATGAFPKQVKLSLRTAAWIESEVEAFMNARIAARDQPEPMPEYSLYMRMGEVMRLTGMTHAMIYDGVRTKTFPKWADLPKRGSGWLKTDIEAWLAARDN